MSDLAAALMVAIRVHAGQVDRQGEPYLLHVLRVVEAVSDEAKPLAALHDVVEDAGTHLLGARLSAEALDGRHYWALMALTRSEAEGDTYADYIQHIADSGDPACEVKLADLRDNLSRMPECEKAGTVMGGEDGCAACRHWASLRRRYEKAIAVLVEAGS